MNNSVECRTCGGAARIIERDISEKEIKEKLQCAACGKTFSRTFKRGKNCTVPECNQREKCVIKYTAERCAIYRAVIMRGLEVQR